MSAARITLFSGALALQSFCSLAIAELPPVDTREALFLRRITEYWKEGHFDDAKNQLLSYLSHYPSSNYLGEVYAMLGDLYLREGVCDQALYCYKMITSPHLQKMTALNRVECLYRLSKFDELAEWADGHPLENNRFHLLAADAYYRKVLREENAEKIRNYAQSALAHFAKSGSLDKEWGYTVAYLSALVGEKGIAADHYLELSDAFPEKKDELLFQAAFLLYEKDPNQSIALFHEIGNRDSSFKFQAVCNELTLLFREKDYETFVAREKEQHVFLEANHKSLFAFFCGTAHLQLDHPQQAIASFQEFLASTPSSKEEILHSLQGMFVLGYKTNNLAVLQEAVERWEVEFPEDRRSLDGLLATAEVALKLKDYTLASTTLEKILAAPLSTGQREVALFDYAQVLLLQDRNLEGCQVFERFLEEYPASPKSSLAQQNLIHASFAFLAQVDKAEQDTWKPVVIARLQKALDQPQLLSSDLHRKYSLHLTNLLFEIGNKKEAAVVGERYVNTYPDHESSKSVYLLLISCHSSLDTSHETIIEMSETALVRETDPALQTKLHLQLYNSYLSQGALEKAAEHLLEVYTKSSSSLKKDNLLWLAEQLKKDNRFALAAEMTEQAIGFNGMSFVNSALLQPCLLEEETLRLKELYVSQGENKKALRLLSALSDIQTNGERASWKFQRRIQFELAQLHGTQGNVDEAIDIYDHLIGDATFANASYYLRAALLERAKLQFSQIPEYERREITTDVLNILGTLKDLQIAKSVESEPVHLEAALEYASIRCMLVPENERMKKMAFYLERIREDFLISFNEASSDYVKERAQWPEQDALIALYLSYIEAEEKRIESLQAKELGQIELSLALEKDAKNTLQILYAEIEHSSSPLNNRVKHSLAQLGDID